MDKVLTRKLFRNRYFKFNPPKKFNNGGLSSLEKGIIAASFAAPLLKSTKAPGQSTISATAQALGSGFEKLPDTLLAIQKSKPAGVESVRQATSSEKSNLGFDVDDNVNVKVKNGVIVDTPIIVKCSENSIKINLLQRPGKKIMSSKEVLNGWKILKGYKMQVIN